MKNGHNILDCQALQININILKLQYITGILKVPFFQ